jgi:hypothetical protein
MRFTLKVACVITAAVALMGGSATVARAGLIEIQVSGLDLVYNGTDIYDAGNILGGIGDPAESDPLISMSFLVDGNLVGTLTSNIFADVYIKDVFNIPVGGGFVMTGPQGNSFGFDLLSSNNNPGFGLALNLDRMQVFYSGSTVFIAGGGVASSLANQNLPFGLVIDGSQPISIAFSSSAMSNVTSAGGFLTGFRSSGTGNVRGTLIPEPAALALVMLAVGSVLTVSRRGR